MPQKQCLSKSEAATALATVLPLMLRWGVIRKEDSELSGRSGGGGGSTSATAPAVTLPL